MSVGCYDVIGLSEEIYHFHVKDSLWGAGVGGGGLCVALVQFIANFIYKH